MSTDSYQPYYQQQLSEAHFEQNTEGFQRLLNFGNVTQEHQQALQGTVICALSDYALIEVGGSEAVQFLQGQLTNDVKQVSSAQAQLTAWCTPKGRVIATFYLLQRGANYYLLLAADRLAWVFKRLQMYVLRADVQLRTATELQVCGFSTTQAEQIPTCFTLPEVNQVEHDNGLSVLTIPAATGTRCFLIAENLQSTWDACLEQGATPAGRSAWNLLDIQAGLPWIETATAQAFIPQMINFPELGGVNFKKGCYTGQEVVARTHYLGKIKRSMRRARLTGNSDCQLTGTALAVADDKQSVGQIVQAAVHPDGGCICLAVVKTDVVTPETVFLQQQPEIYLEWLE
ncbi:CAF17-like 4Fe-4S cluster assembly/insertion protein YgfZ [Candidatus Venteria ishoeyi]|uniref:tRNA-modifying protein YgfZ n=1 Tax=Candidatus Venteria ishoeyi TaxID=1899563 RepID=A0A1H6FC21_9GAMM|nr:folate-binding protein YgfZ [Candidatus Venteria ishoeyi]MDM8545727.1 folate-binding protein YgfZ [Candidatus Venteria ishoeyi]SEH07640.1 tRNA-modifying protein YgfZ [Candidatus Venteria ishoeyi]